MSTRTRNLAIAHAVHAALYMPLVAVAAELPVPCTAGSCVASTGAPVPGWLGSGNASATASGNTLNINQLTSSAVYNWRTFNISADGTVRFNQPGADSIALNRIFQGQSNISGTLSSNGRVYLLNQNGILFGQGAKVNVAGLIASSLDISTTALDSGIANAVADGQAAFTQFRGSDGAPLQSGGIRVGAGAEITAAEGGQVLMFAPEIVNQGRIATPGGQTMLAAGNQVYLATSADPNLRGLLVEVGTGGGTVTNGDLVQQVGEIIAERGNITLAGLAVNQLGRVTATTTVRENGSIRLQARDGGAANQATDLLQRGLNNGELTLGAGSTSQVLLAGSDKAVDATEQLRSRIEMQGRSVQILQDARVLAKGGLVAVDAIANSDSLEPQPFSATTGSRIFVADGAVIDVSGASVELSVERNIVSAELRGNELANSPVQRDGPLRGQAVRVDIRDSGTRADGTSWQGTPLGDVSGQVSLIERDVSERNLSGGTVRLGSTRGDVVMQQGSKVDLSGGHIRYTDGFVETSQVLGTDGVVYDISAADPGRSYVGLTGAKTSLFDRRWGVTRNYLGFGSVGQFEQGYVEGRDAGSLQIVAPQAVLDGQVLASTVTGVHQRRPTTDLASGQTFRPFDQLPLGGRLVIGHEPSSGDTDRVAGNVAFGGGLVLPGLSGNGAAAFDPRRDALPEDLPIMLRTDLFGAQRIARVQVNSNDRVELPADVQLVLPGQGELHVAARVVEIAGDVTAPAGDIDLAAVDTLRTSPTAAAGVSILSGAHLDVRGAWVNDSARFNAPGAQLAPLLIDGGHISLAAGAGSLSLAEGSVIDVSGGAWAQANGRIAAGDAGGIELVARRAQLNRPAVDLQLGAELRAFGIDQGGALSISAPELCIAGSDCTDGVAGSLWLSPERLLAAGFADISLSSNERGLTVKSGTSFDLRQRNLLLDAAVLNIAGGAPIESLGVVTTLPDHLRAPMRLSLEASIANAEGAYTAAQFATLPGLTIEQGAALLGSAGSQIALESNTNLVVAGLLSTPGGSIDLSLNSSLVTTGEFANQGIWLDSTASLQARGTFVQQPDARGLRVGEVLDGGQVRINAGRGSIIANAGSTIDVSGTSAELDLRRPGGTVLDTSPVRVASDGGSIELLADRSMVLGGELRARAGEGSSSAAGGSLALTLGPGSVARIPEADETRTISVTQTLPSRSIAPGNAVPEALARRADVSVATLEQGGFSEVELRARTTLVQDTSTTNRTITAPGQIQFAGGVDLNLPGRLLLDAAAIVGTGTGAVQLNAPYIRIGNTDAALQQTVAPVAQAGAGTLRVNGGFIDVVGNSIIDGFDAVRLQSAGDLRLNGLQKPNSGSIIGSLTTAANLTLAARQVYASTLSDFTLALQGNAEGVVRFEKVAGERADVLSAGSRLRVSAPTIEQAGVLRAPFGLIDLVADELRLEQGSLTSTSAEGRTVPFGSLQAGKDWVYALQNVTLVVGDTLDLPQQSVALTADNIDVRSGAVIDVSGGGDLLGYEFMPGTGGRRDVLSAIEQPGRYAIVPGLRLDYAPIDPQESTGSGLRPGDSIHLSTAVDGLPAGDYVLLPARYALLPGAFVVEARAGYTDLPSGQVIRQLDGSAIVPGFLRTQGTAFADARSGGFEIRSAALVKTEAQYNTALASKFFPAQALREGTVAPRLPQDAGVLALDAGSGLNIDGSLRANAVDGARGAAVDVSADQLRVADAGTGVAGEVVVSAADLNALGAESILLGGRRRATNDGTALDVSADSVVVEADLAAPEIMLAARNEVRVADGAELLAQGDVPVADRYLVDGDGALLRLAAGDQAMVIRSGETGARGQLVLEDGSRLAAAGGALALDASLDTRSQAQLSLAGGALSLGASKINLGDVPGSESGLSLSTADLAAAGASEVALVSRSTIDVFGNFSLQLADLTLDSAGLRGVGAGASASIRAGNTLTLINSSGSGGSVGTGDGTLELSAATVVIGAGEQSIAGFQGVRLAATNAVRVEDTGVLSAASGLNVVTPVLTAATGARGTLRAAGELVLSAPTAAGTPATSTGLGGKVALVGAEVTVGTRIDAGAGEIALTATSGDVTLATGANLDASGRTRDFDGHVVAAAGGRIALSATHGDVIAQSGSMIDVGAAAQGEAGELRVSAPTGTVVLGGQVDGTASTAALGGRVSIDAASLAGFANLNRALGNGFQMAREFRQRGAGDLVVDAAAGNVTARDVSLTADGGSLVVTGTIDATGVADGRVRLAARDDVRIDGTVRAGGNGGATDDPGRMEVFADSGAIRFGNAANIDLAGGDLTLRLQRAVLLDLLDGDPATNGLVLAPAGSDIGRTTIEAFRRYTEADALLAQAGVIAAGNTTASSSNPLFADAASFISTNAAPLLAALGRSADPSVRILPGVELLVGSDLSLGAATGNTVWDLSQWRFGNAAELPGVLTLRATGNLTINGALNDGFGATGLGATGTPQQNQAAFRLTNGGDSWSYRLIAGADASSANLLAVNDQGTGNFSIASGNAATGAASPPRLRLVRTGTGSIDVAAGGNFVLGNAQSVLYTAGVPATGGVQLGIGTTGLGGRTYPNNGGDIDIHVGGSIQGAPGNQLVTDWLWRVGKDPVSTLNGVATGWTVNFARFQQNVAALGGGDVRISAGRDIVDFSASIPSIGMQTGGTTAALSAVRVIGGGDLEVRAGGDIRGGSYYIGRGDGSLQAGGDVGASALPGRGLYPVLALGEGRWDVTATGSVGIESVVNPTLLAQGLSQVSSPAPVDNSSFFSTYGADSSVNLLSAAGDVLLSNNLPLLESVLGSVNWSDPPGANGTRGSETLALYAPGLRAASLGGDLILRGRTTLFPARGAPLELYAEGDIRRGLADGGLDQLIQSDADPALLPSSSAPDNSAVEILQAATTNQHAARLFHAGDASIAKIVARTGDISFAQSGPSDSNALLALATPLRMVAGGDIIDVPLVIQHDDAADVSSIAAGGDIRFTTARAPNGTIGTNTRAIDIDGPGTLQLTAGGNVDLQNSAGITSRGNLANPALPGGGADISILVGAAESAADYAAMIQKYLVESPAYDSALLAEVQRQTGAEPADKAAALAAFQALGRQRQRALLERLLLAELRAAAEYAASADPEKNNDYTRGFAALEALFPGANPDTEAEEPEVNPYRGDLNLYFSRVYTQSGGDIRLLAPGGEVNAGLATPPTSFGINKSADLLGIVARNTGDIGILAYNDLQVNESRVFAVNDSDILVWSTSGDIDAGRGAKTAISAPSPVITFDRDGRANITYSAALAGSGIQARTATPEQQRGAVVLAAPRGIVNAGDAGIVAGDLTIAATAVVGADNISFSGVAVGAPVDTGGLGTSLAGVSAAATSASSSATEVGPVSGETASTTPLTETALTWLDVFVTGLGDEDCRADDAECLQRSRQ